MEFSISPHGGTLPRLLADPETAERFKAEACDVRAVILSPRRARVDRQTRRLHRDPRRYLARSLRGVRSQGPLQKVRKRSSPIRQRRAVQCSLDEAKRNPGCEISLGTMIPGFRPSACIQATDVARIERSGIRGCVLDLSPGDQPAPGRRPPSAAWRARPVHHLEVGGASARRRHWGIPADGLLDRAPRQALRGRCVRTEYPEVKPDPIAIDPK